MLYSNTFRRLGGISQRLGVYPACDRTGVEPNAGLLRSVGMGFLKGEGVRPNREVAQHYLQAAAQAGDVTARCVLAMGGAQSSAPPPREAARTRSLPAGAKDARTVSSSSSSSSSEQTAKISARCQQPHHTSAR